METLNSKIEKKKTVKLKKHFHRYLLFFNNISAIKIGPFKTLKLSFSSLIHFV